MAVADHILIRGSTQRNISAVLTSSNSADVLSGGTTGTIYMRARGATTNKINGAAITTVTATTSQIAVDYAPAAADVDLAGDFELYFLINFGGARTDRFPADPAKFYSVKILESYE